MLPIVPVNEIEINLDLDILTSQRAATCLTTLFESLAFHRKQIPFSFDVYRFMVDKIKPIIKLNDSTDEDEEYDANKYNLDRHRLLAIEAFDSMQQMIKNIKKQFETFEVDSAIIQFGSTFFTPKEMFIINLPKISQNHSPANHQELHHQHIAKTITMSLIKSATFWEKPIPTKSTNMFVCLSMRGDAAVNLEILNPLDSSCLFLPPKSCTTTIFNIKNESPSIVMNCCRDLIVFKELEHLNLSADDALKRDENIEMETNENEDEDEDDVDYRYSEEVRSYFKKTTWYELTDYVNGYTDALVRGKSIWV